MNLINDLQNAVHKFKYENRGKEPEGIIINQNTLYLITESAFFVEGVETDNPKMFGIKVYRSFDIEVNKFRVF